MDKEDLFLVIYIFINVSKKRTTMLNNLFISPRFDTFFQVLKILDQLTTDCNMNKPNCNLKKTYKILYSIFETWR